MRRLTLVMLALVVASGARSQGTSPPASLLSKVARDLSTSAVAKR